MRSTSRLRVSLLSICVALVLGGAVASADGAPAMLDPLFVEGFVVLKQTAAFTAQGPDDPRVAWRPNLQLWVGVKATRAKKQTIGFVQLTTLPPSSTNDIGRHWQPELRTNEWWWSATTNRNGLLNRSQFITPLYPVRVRVFDASGKQRKEGETLMA